MKIATTPEIDALLKTNAPVAIGVSGGKDSQAAALATEAHLDAIGHNGPRVLIHADLGVVEWNASLSTCERLAAHLGLELIVVRRKAGDLMDRWESRWESSVERYANLATVTLVPCWSTPSMRFCTSELKTHVITAELKRRYKSQTIINVTGVRRQESKARSKGTVAGPDATGRIWNWRPLSDWSTPEVFAYVTGRGLPVHIGYTEYGLTRISCRFCIMSSIADLIAAAMAPESHDLYRRMVALEIASTFAFQGSRWLGDVRPMLLGFEQSDAFMRAKEMALARVKIESRITNGMLYVKGWPTRMLTDEEAGILAGVRLDLAQLFGWHIRYTDSLSIHHRYAELMNEAEDRAEAKGLK